MSKKQIESTLAVIAAKVFQTKDVNVARKTFIEHVSKTNVKDKDKMLKEVSTMTSLQEIQKYTANALLKFEGLSNKLNNKNK